MSFDISIYKRLLYVIAFILCFEKTSTATRYLVEDSITVDTIIGSFSKWQVIATTGSTKDTGSYFPNLPINVCFIDSSNQSRQCETVLGEEVIGFEYIRYRDKDEPTRGLLLKTNSFGSGGGPVFISLWVYNKSIHRFCNILPSEMHVKALGAYEFFPNLKNMNVLVTADPERYFEDYPSSDDPGYMGVWASHYFLITIYKFTQDHGFIKIGSYKTSKKYDPEDDDIIKSEIKRVKMYLK